MTVLVIAALGIVFGFVFLLSTSESFHKKPDKSADRKKGTFAARQVVTEREQSMFWRLCEAFPAPTFSVHCQMSFGALLIAKDGASRHSFAQKMADFVVMDKSFKVIAIVELDDPPPQGREALDYTRDKMLKAGGYRVLRYRKVPSLEILVAETTLKMES